MSVAEKKKEILEKPDWCCEGHKKGYLLLSSECTPQEKRIALDVLQRADRFCRQLSAANRKAISRCMMGFL